MLTEINEVASIVTTAETISLPMAGNYTRLIHKKKKNAYPTSTMLKAETCGAEAISLWYTARAV
jgi:hypothetical protein